MELFFLRVDVSPPAEETQNTSLYHDSTTPIRSEVFIALRTVSITIFGFSQEVITLLFRTKVNKSVIAAQGRELARSNSKHGCATLYDNLIVMMSVRSKR